MAGATQWDLGAQGALPYESIHFDYEGDHRGICIKELPGFLRTQPRIRHLMRALGGGIQDVEDVLWGALEGSILDSAVGDALDRWGTLVGEARGSLISDSNFRPVINARILANSCTGSVDSIMGVMIAACAPSLCIEHIPQFPGGYQMQVTRERFMTESRRLRVRRILASITPGGRDSRYIEIVDGGFAPIAACAHGAFGGPMARTI